MWLSSHRSVVVIAIIAAFSIASLGCGGDDEAAGGSGGSAGTGGVAGTGGSAGSGGMSGAVSIELPECAVEGYQVILSGLWGGLDAGLHNVLRHMDHEAALASGIGQVRAQLPDLEDLPPIEDLEDPAKPRPRVLWSTFRWLSAPNSANIKARIFQRLDEGLYLEPRAFLLDNGFYQGTVAVVNWTVGEKPPIGAGTFSIAGLDADSVRVTIIRFPECEPPEGAAADAAFVCSEADPTEDDNPWYEDGLGCRFELTSLSFNLNLAQPTEPYGTVIGFTAQLGELTLDNGSLIVAQDGTTSLTARFGGELVTIEVDLAAEQLILEFPGEPEQGCTYDSAIGEILDCSPTGT